jgi:hypothetical protein
MKIQQLTRAGIIAGALVGGVALWAQSSGLEPNHEFGTSVIAVYEGWFQNPDGTFSILMGYLNRNSKQEVDIPIGPNNRIEPGGPDRGQPTHFLIGRQTGLFAIKVPADFGKNKVTWTLVANGQATAVPVWLNPDYEISPFIEAAVSNTPPTLKFEPNGPMVQGPQGLNTRRTATVGAPLTLDTWVNDDEKWTSNSGAKPRNQSPIPVTVTWTKYRGPGTVKFDKDRPAVQKLEETDPKLPFHGKATTTATFSEPGEYMLHVAINDYSGPGGAGFQCCWSNGTVNVTVK